MLKTTCIQLSYKVELRTLVTSLPRLLGFTTAMVNLITPIIMSAIKALLVSIALELTRRTQTQSLSQLALPL
jgi:hypothetical protein